MLDAKAIFKDISRTAGTVIGRSGVSPNTLTGLGVGLTAVAGWQIVAGNFFVAACVLSAGSVLDFFDGAVARATGKASPLGAFVDSVSDRFSDAIVMSTLAWAMFTRDDELLAALALAALVFGQLTSYIRAKAESLGYDCKVGVMERAERILAVIAGLALSVLLPVVLWVLAALSAVTVAQRVVHVGKQARARG